MKNLETPGKTGRVGRYVKTRLFIPQNVTLPLTCSCYQLARDRGKSITVSERALGITN